MFQSEVRRGETMAHRTAKGSLAAFLLIGGILLILLDGKLKQLFHTKLAGPIRLAGGAVTGVFFLLLILSLLTYVLILWPSVAFHKPYADGGSKTGPFIGKLAPQIYQSMEHPSGVFQKSKK